MGVINPFESDWERMRRYARMIEEADYGYSSSASESSSSSSSSSEEKSSSIEYFSEEEFNVE